MVISFFVSGTVTIQKFNPNQTFFCNITYFKITANCTWNQEAHKVSNWDFKKNFDPIVTCVFHGLANILRNVIRFSLIWAKIIQALHDYKHIVNTYKIGYSYISWIRQEPLKIWKTSPMSICTYFWKIKL